MINVFLQDFQNDGVQVVRGDFLLFTVSYFLQSESKKKRLIISLYLCLYLTNNYLVSAI